MDFSLRRIYTYLGYRQAMIPVQVTQDSKPTTRAHHQQTNQLGTEEPTERLKQLFEMQSHWRWRLWSFEGFLIMQSEREMLQTYLWCSIWWTSIARNCRLWWDYVSVFSLWKPEKLVIFLQDAFIRQKRYEIPKLVSLNRNWKSIISPNRSAECSVDILSILRPKQ